MVGEDRRINATQYKRRVLRQIASKIIYDLPPDDDDSRRVLRLASEMFEKFIATNPTRRA